jgi:hypothetical protein
MKIVNEYLMHIDGRIKFRKFLEDVLTEDALEHMNFDEYVSEAEERMCELGDDAYAEIPQRLTKSGRVELLDYEPSWFDIEKTDLDEDF